MSRHGHLKGKKIVIGLFMMYKEKAFHQPLSEKVRALLAGHQEFSDIEDYQSGL